MSQQKKLEKVLDLLISEESDRAAELLHQIIVEKARAIYEDIVDEESIEDEEQEEAKELDEADDEVGGEPNADFSAEISTDIDDIDADELNDGEPGDDMDAMDMDDEMGEEGDVENRLDDLEAEHDEFESELEKLRADYAEIMAELGMEGSEEEEAGEEEEEEGEEEEGEEEEESFVPGMEEEYEEESAVYEKKKDAKMKKAAQPMKELKKGKKAVEEETQFLKKVADTGQRGKAGLVGAGTHSKLGAEQDKSMFTKPPAKRSYGGEPANFGKGTGGEYGKYHGEHANDDTPSDNLDVEPKKSAHKADKTPKYTGGKPAGEAGDKSPFSKKPGGAV